MSATTTADVTVEERLDRMATQLDELTAEMRRQRAQRDMVAELTHELGPIARDAMATASTELEDLELTTEDLVRFARTLATTLPRLERALAQVGPISDLLAEVTALSGPAVQSMTDRFEALEEKGYAGFARQSVGVLDRVVTNFSEDDVKALGDNVVLILETVKEMTQPEIMSMLQRTAHLVNEPEGEPIEPPSLFALIRDMRDPDVRRGLARMLTVLRSMGE